MRSSSRSRILSALFGLWQDVGVTVDVGTHTMAEYGDSWTKNEGLDLLIGRWIADYDDPDNFTYSQFHGTNGNLRAWLSSPEMDAALEEARVETRPGVREGLYRTFEDGLVESAMRDVIVRRGSAPHAPGDPLPLTVPPALAAQLQPRE